MPDKLQTFMVQFENPSGIYFPGDTVNGQVLITLTEAMTMRGVRLEISGITKTRWKAMDDYRVDSESYINIENTLWGNAPNSKDANPTMQPGLYQFPFSFLLPLNCLASYEGQFGYIRYSCLAFIELPYMFNKTSIGVITVISLVDLNLIPNVEMPVSDEQLKTVSACCGSGGTIKGTLKIQQSGFAPGEVILINLDIVNSNGSTSDSEVTIRIEENVDFYAKSNTRNNIRILGKECKCRFEPGKMLGIKIPQVSPTISNCRLIKVNYFLILKLDKFVDTDLSFSIPIIIGNVPLRAAMPVLKRNYELAQRNGMPLQNMPFRPLTGGTYPDLPPPSYQDHVFEPQDIQDKEGRKLMKFAPKYAYYDWSQSSVAKNF